MSQNKVHFSWFVLMVLILLSLFLILLKTCDDTVKEHRALAPPASHPTAIPTTAPAANPGSDPGAMPTLRPTLRPTPRPTATPAPALETRPTPQPSVTPASASMRDSTSRPTAIPTSRSITTSVYSCTIRKTCSEMSSCEEAYYHLNACGNRRLDRDKDGVPCENICPEG